MVASDDIEGLLAHTDLFFEVRCRTEELIQYLKQKKTLHRLLDFIFLLVVRKQLSKHCS